MEPHTRAHGSYEAALSGVCRSWTSYVRRCSCLVFMPGVSTSAPSTTMSTRQQRRLVDGLITDAALRGPLGQHEPGTGRGQGSSGKPLRGDLWRGHDQVMIGPRSHQRANPDRMPRSYVGAALGSPNDVPFVLSF